MRFALVAALFASSAFSAPERPLYVDRPVQADDLTGRSLRELTLMRNWIYARRGNEFRKGWLRDFFTAQKWYQPNQSAFLTGEWRLNSDDDSALVARDDENAEAIAEYESKLTSEQLVAMRDGVLARGKDGGAMDAADLVELKLLSVRLGGWGGAPPPPRDLTPLEEPKQLDGLLTLAQLADLSARDLKLLRNTIFARRGRPFETPLVKGHFKTVQWYQPDAKYSDKRLTDVDKKNVKLIQSVEKQLKREAEQNYMVAA